jgi:hypothetical protein
MQIERHETGSRMSKAVIHGDTVYLAGIVADSPKGKGMAKLFRRHFDAGSTPRERVRGLYLSRECADGSGSNVRSLTG